MSAPRRFHVWVRSPGGRTWDLVAFGPRTLGGALTTARRYREDFACDVLVLPDGVNPNETLPVLAENLSWYIEHKGHHEKTHSNET